MRTELSNASEPWINGSIVYPHSVSNWAVAIPSIEHPPNFLYFSRSNKSCVINHLCSFEMIISCPFRPEIRHILHCICSQRLGRILSIKIMLSRAPERWWPSWGTKEETTEVGRRQVGIGIFVKKFINMAFHDLALPRCGLTESSLAQLWGCPSDALEHVVRSGAASPKHVQAAPLWPVSETPFHGWGTVFHAHSRRERPGRKAMELTWVLRHLLRGFLCA